MNPEQAAQLRKHTIVALDVDTQEQALALVDALFPAIDKFKIGSRMFTAFGPSILDAIGKRGASVFLDLKYHDIPSVVGSACAAAANHDAVFMLTVHASGGSHMVASAVEAVKNREGLKVVAVTALTSLGAPEIHSFGVECTLGDWAEKLALLALDADAHGIVCSAQELARLRPILPETTLFVTPGIRAADAVRDDQTRTMSAREALDLGSSYLVIGRPVYQAADPLLAIQKIGASL